MLLEEWLAGHITVLHKQEILLASLSVFVLSTILVKQLLVVAALLTEEELGRRRLRTLLEVLWVQLHEFLALFV